MFNLKAALSGNSIKLKASALLVLLSLSLMLPAKLFSQPGLLWEKSYNNPNMNGDDYASKSVIDNAGNIYVTGGTRDGNGLFDILTLKYDPAGNLLWTRVYYNLGTPGGEASYDIMVDPNGNVYVSGMSIGAPNIFDAMLIKYNSAGVLQWTRRINKSSFSERRGDGVSMAFHNNVIYLGCRFTYNNISEFGIARYGVNGDSLSYLPLAAAPGNGGVFLANIVESGNGDIYAAGYGDFMQGEMKDIAVFKVAGNAIVWSKAYRGPSHKDDYVNEIMAGPDGNIFITGSSEQNNQGHDVITVKYGRDDGSVIWEKRYNNNVNNNNEFGKYIRFDNSGNVFVLGAANGITTGEDLVTLKYSPAGAPLWSKTYNHAENNADRGYGMVTDGSGNAYVSASSWDISAGVSNFVTIKYSSSGAVDWVKQHNGVSGSDQPKSININTDGSLIITGNIRNAVTQNDVVTLKYGSTIGIQQLSGEVPSKFELGQNYPNPFNPVTNINFSLPKAGNVKLAVFDAAGKQVAELLNGELSAGSYNFDFDASHLSSGVYFYRLQAGGITEVKKMMLVK